MKIVLQREQFRDTFKAAAKVVPTRTTQPILQNVLMHAGIDGIYLLAQGGEIALRLEAGGCATVERAGDVLLDAQKIGTILSECKSPQMTAELVGTTLKLKGDRSEFKLPSESPQGYPVPDFAQGGSSYSMSCLALATAINRAIFACDEETGKYALGGVRFEVNGSAIDVVATDGRRMVHQQAGAAVVGEHTHCPIVPTKGLRTIAAMCGGQEGDAEIWTDGNSFCVKTTAGIVSARLLEGRFPKWQDVFPAKKGVQLRLPVGDLLSAVKQASVMCSEESRGIQWTVANGTLSLTSRASERGESAIELVLADAEAKSEVALDYRYSIDYLQSIGDTDFVTLQLIGPEHAALFTTDDGGRYVLMPLAAK
jgi:DNA polymerase-3 subunit beta